MNFQRQVAPHREPRFSPAERREQEWERGIGPVEERAASGPVRTIPVTPAMQEADRRRAAASQLNPVATAWRARVLGGRAVATPKPEPAPTSQFMTVDARKRARMRQCTTCPHRTTEHTSGKCFDCRYREQREKEQAV